jgi:hypothetical protein
MPLKKTVLQLKRIKILILKAIGGLASPIWCASKAKNDRTVMT